MLKVELTGQSGRTAAGSGRNAREQVALFTHKVQWIVDGGS